MWDYFLQKVVRNFLDFQLLAFCWYFCYEEQFFGTNESLKVKYLKTHLFKKKFRTAFWKLIFSLQVSGKEYFLQKIFFHWLGAFFTSAKHRFGRNFFHKKIILYFFQVWLINFNAILKHALKTYQKKKKKNTTYPKSLQPTLKVYI